MAMAKFSALIYLCPALPTRSSVSWFWKWHKREVHATAEPAHGKTLCTYVVIARCAQTQIIEISRAHMLMVARCLFRQFRKTGQVNKGCMVVDKNFGGRQSGMRSYGRQ